MMKDKDKGGRAVAFGFSHMVILNGAAHQCWISYKQGHRSQSVYWLFPITYSAIQIGGMIYLAGEGFGAYEGGSKWAIAFQQSMNTSGLISVLLTSPALDAFKQYLNMPIIGTTAGWGIAKHQPKTGDKISGFLHFTLPPVLARADALLSWYQIADPWLKALVGEDYFKERVRKPVDIVLNIIGFAVYFLQPALACCINYRLPASGMKKLGFAFGDVAIMLAYLSGLDCAKSFVGDLQGPWPEWTRGVATLLVTCSVVFAGLVISAVQSNTGKPAWMSFNPAWFLRSKFIHHAYAPVAAGELVDIARYTPAPSTATASSIPNALTHGLPTSQATVLRSDRASALSGDSGGAYSEGGGPERDGGVCGEPMESGWTEISLVGDDGGCCWMWDERRGAEAGQRGGVRERRGWFMAESTENDIADGDS